MFESHNMQMRPSDADDRRWRAVARRDTDADGEFFYGVTSTRVFCRPGCPSRRPRRDRVRFFASAAEAAAAGFRACRKCRPDEPHSTPEGAVDRAAAFLARNADRAVPLARLARVAGVSPFQLQRRFKQTLGVSPREFQAAQRAERFRRELRAGREVVDAVYEAGYGSPSRVYETPPTGRGMTPARYRRGGEGSEIGFVTVKCDLGWLLVAATRDGVCAVTLGERAAALEEDLRREFPRARIERDRLVRREWVQAVIDRIAGTRDAASLPLDVRGTAFQWRVWRALQAIPSGETRTYAEIAAAIGAPAAVRAVASACASNHVALVVPCHRVIPKTGGAGRYRWGAGRKARLLEAEKKPK